MNQRLIITALGVLASASTFAQIPDLVNAFDAGGRAMGMGGATYVTGSDTLSNYYNPAGLAYLDRAMIGMTFRNFPQSRTTVTGDIGPAGTQRLDSAGEKGPTGLGHAGLAFPLKNRNGGNNGVIAISTTSAGQLRDERISGAGLTEGGITAVGFTQLIKSDTDFVNLSYARGNTDGSLAWGVGAIYAINRQVNIRNAPSGSLNLTTKRAAKPLKMNSRMEVKNSADFRSKSKMPSGKSIPDCYKRQKNMLRH